MNFIGSIQWLQMGKSCAHIIFIITEDRNSQIISMVVDDVNGKLSIILSN